MSEYNKNALEPCKSCGEMISGISAKCPKCGHIRSLKDRLTTKQIIALFFAIASLPFFLKGYDILGVIFSFGGFGYLFWSNNKKSE